VNQTHVNVTINLDRDEAVQLPESEVQVQGQALTSLDFAILSWHMQFTVSTLGLLMLSS